MDYLLRKLDADNVFELIQYCIDFEADKKLMEKCKQFLQFNTENALKTKSFNDISAKCLKVLLEQDCISVPEVDLFKAVLFTICFLQLFLQFVGVVENQPNFEIKM